MTKKITSLNLNQSESLTICLDSLKINEREIGPVEVPLSFSDNWLPMLNFGGFATIADLFQEGPRIECTFSGSKNVINMLAVHSKFSFDRNLDDVVLAQPTSVPIILDYGKLSSCMCAVVQDLPDSISADFILDDGCGRVFRVSPSNIKGDRSARVNLDYVTDAKECLSVFSDLQDFLAFLKGGNCGVGNVVAKASDSSSAFCLIGFTRCDVTGHKRGWFDFAVQEYISDIFLLFCQFRSNEQSRKALKQTINFYRASNYSRDISVEVSIVTAHTALEAVVHFVLEYRAGWSKNLLKTRSLTFHDKMRAAATFLGVNDDVDSESDTIKRVVREKNLEDGFEAISFVRNKLVHQDANFIPTGLLLHDIWLSAQWLTEVMIFGLIGYDGQMVDRRIIRGSRGGNLKPVPLCR